MRARGWRTDVTQVTGARAPVCLRCLAVIPILRMEAPNDDSLSEVDAMRWTKPKAEVVAVTLEVTAYVATL